MATKVSYGVGIDRAPDIILKHTEASGVNGGTATAGSWQTRPINAEIRDVNNDVTLSSDSFVLPAGTWYAKIVGTHFHGDNLKDRLRNTTSSVTLVTGISRHASGSNEGSADSQGVGVFTIAAGQTIKLEYRVQTTQATDGLGRQTTGWGTNVYATIELWRIS